MEMVSAKKKFRLKPQVLVLLFLTMSFVPDVTFGRFVVEKNNIQVISPDSIANKYDSAIGNFGAPDYGGSMVLDVKAPDHASDGCTAFGTPIFKRTSSKSNPTAALLDRGGCFFALKVWNAQNAGAAAVLIADNQDEPLITMDSPEQDDAAEYVDQITIPSAFIQKKLGDTIKSELSKKTVTVKLDWSESLPHPDDKVEYEFWTSSNDECGFKCETQVEFVKNFKGAAQLLEKGGYTTFTPHYITWYCPDEFTKSKQCQSECINHGRYCAPDPEQDFDKGYDGKDVVKENLRQLCVFQAANQSGKPWVWWDYVSDMHIRCPFKNNKYSEDCAESVVRSLGLSVDEIRTCIGNPDSDSDHPMLKAEQDAQVGTGNRGDVTILPTLVINDGQYRGKLDKGPVLKAICSGFRESTEPSVCLSDDIQTNECLTNNGGCWKNNAANITACKDTFRGRICECPVVDGVQFQGDGYTYCEAVGPGRCKINNGGCWTQTKDGQTFSACQTTHLKGCDCPPGFRGDGKQCEDIDECKEKTACQCSDCNCQNKWGGYDCTCKNGLLYMREQDACVGKVSQTSVWMVISLLFISMVGTGVAGYVIYRHRMRAYMDTEIRAIMSQYMSLEDDNDLHQPLHR